MSVSLERLVRNQVILRDVNERLREVANPGAHGTEYICECSDTECLSAIKLEAKRYRQVRATRNVFFIVPGHERLEVERIIEEQDSYVLVEKLLPVDAAGWPPDGA